MQAAQKQPIRLIALDLDGTVFDDSKKISPRTLALLQQKLDEGVLVLPATGRPAVGIPEEFLALRGVNYAITSNGATVVQLQPRKILYEQYLDRAVSFAIFDFLRQLDCLVTLFFGGGGYYDLSSKSELGRFIPANLVQYILESRTFVPNLRGYLEGQNAGVEKFSVFFPSDEARDAAIAAITAQFGIVPVIGAPRNLEITAPGVHKGSGLRALAEVLGIPLTQTMAVGDSGNDLEMLQTAGIGVAMANARPEVLAIADYVTLDNNHDGVAHAIEQLVL